MLLFISLANTLFCSQVEAVESNKRICKKKKNFHTKNDPIFRSLYLCEMIRKYFFARAKRGCTTFLNERYAKKDNSS